MFLSANDKQSLAARVAALEKRLGLDVVTLVVGKSDTYPETVWKAFALGASLTALVVAVGEVLHPDWVSVGSVFSAAATILGVGALCALACVYVPAFARVFLREARAALETHQYAKAQFLERELFATRERTAILVLVSMLGMSPRATFPIMMGACAFLMPVASAQFVRKRKYSLRAAAGLAAGGIFGSALALLVVKEMNLRTVMWLVTAVVVYTGLSLLRSAMIERKNGAVA